MSGHERPSAARPRLRRPLFALIAAVAAAVLATIGTLATAGAEPWVRHAAGPARDTVPQTHDVATAVATGLRPAATSRAEAHAPGSRPEAANGDDPTHQDRPALTGPTRFGVAVHTVRGQSYRQALDQTLNRYGRIGVVRKYYTGLPASWSRITRDIGSLTPVVSFKAGPSAVLSGRYDAYLRKWFASAPTDRTVYWVYFHEPENDVAAHAFSAAQYRAAWAHVAELAAAAHRSNLRATLTLMCWTLAPGSHRDWHDYYAGRRYVDVLAWDCYNKAIQRAGYASPPSMFGQAVATSRAAGLPVAFAEMGSKLASGDSGVRRAAWLTEVAQYLSAKDAVFVCYFDSTVGGEFRLLDRASILAWRAVVSDQRP
ncbi:MAG TPA: hypothetical protein VF053_18045 [Streptosporangiales bacterium]